MPERAWGRSKPGFAGLIFRVGKQSWFWGWWGTPSALSLAPATTPLQNSAVAAAEWSNVAEWLRHMHAHADRPPGDSPNQEK